MLLVGFCLVTAIGHPCQPLMSPELAPFLKCHSDAIQPVHIRSFPLLGLELGKGRIQPLYISSPRRPRSTRAIRRDSTTLLVRSSLQGQTRTPSRQRRSRPLRPSPYRWSDGARPSGSRRDQDRTGPKPSTRQRPSAPVPKSDGKRWTWEDPP